MHHAVVSANFFPSTSELSGVGRIRIPSRNTRRLNKVTRRNRPTRWTMRSFNRFYDHLLTRRSKILFTTSFAAMRNA